MARFEDFHPFTEDQIREFLDNYRERQIRIQTNGCGDCEALNQICIECLDNRMRDRVSRLAKQLKSYRKRMDAAGDSPVVDLMNRIQNGDV
tara:strand:- start:813 stop:1085 length:273 start_codon:yes stop_codon:yes gene_type:complete